MSTTAAENARRDSTPIDYSAMTTLGSITAYFAQRQPHAIAMRFEGRDTDYATLERHANQVANALTTSGCGVGDRIAYVGKNTDLFFELLFGAAKAGVVVAPIVWRLAPPEIAQIVRDTRAGTLFIGADLWQHVDALRAELPGVTFVPMEAASSDTMGFAAWRDAASDAIVTTDISEDHVALQLYTSGTTGLPKGAMLSHANILSARREAMNFPMAWNTWGSEDVSLVAMPVGHIGGVGWGLVGFFNGARNVIMREFVPAMVLDAMERERISKLFLVPTALPNAAHAAARPRDRLQQLTLHPVRRRTDHGRAAARMRRSIRMRILSAIRDDGDDRNDRVSAARRSRPARYATHARRRHSVARGRDPRRGYQPRRVTTGFKRAKSNRDPSRTWSATGANPRPPHRRSTQTAGYAPATRATSTRTATSTFKTATKT